MPALAWWLWWKASTANTMAIENLKQMGVDEFPGSSSHPAESG